MGGIKERRSGSDRLARVDGSERVRPLEERRSRQRQRTCRVVVAIERGLCRLDGQRLPWLKSNSVSKGTINPELEHDVQGITEDVVSNNGFVKRSMNPI